MGETVQKLNERINSHKTVFLSPSKYGHSNPLPSFYFSNAQRDQISNSMEKQLGYERINHGSIDSYWIQIIKNKELSGSKDYAQLFCMVYMIK